MTSVFLYNDTENDALKCKSILLFLLLVVAAAAVVVE